MDALERDRLRRRMAQHMRIFMGQSTVLDVVSGHWVEEERSCELAPEIRSHEFVVVKNRAGKTMTLAVATMAEMVRFKVVEDPRDLKKWLEKIKLLRAESEKRREEELREREQKRQQLERKVIVRKRGPQPA